jgi:hypothetical protein
MQDSARLQHATSGGFVLRYRERKDSELLLQSDH